MPDTFSVIEWIVFNNQSSSQQSLPRIRLYDCYFPSDVFSIDFKLSGLMSLIRCELKGAIGLHLEKGQYEPDITGKSLQKLNSKQYQNRIEIIQTRFNLGHIEMYINNAARHLKMENVDLSVEYVRIISTDEGQDCQTVNVFELEVINCRMSTDIRLHLRLSNSFAKFRFKNTVFEKISFDSVQYVGLASYVFDNCTFSKALGVDIQRFVDFKILGSSINVPYDCQVTDCTVHLKEVDNDNLVSNRKLSEIFFNQINKYSFKSSLFIYSSTFQGGCGPFFTITDTVLEFIENTSHIQRHKTCPEKFIDLQHKYKYFYYSL